MNPILQQKLTYTASSNPFYNEDFRRVLDPHLEYLKTAGNVRKDVVINNDYAGQFKGDFYAILMNMNIVPKYHRIIMLANGFTNPIQYDGQIDRILIPDTDIMDNILMVYNTGKNKLKNNVPGE